MNTHVTFTSTAQFTRDDLKRRGLLRTRQRVVLSGHLNPFRIVAIDSATKIQLREIYTDIRGWF